MADLNVLAVDDSRTMRELLKATLIGAGFRVETAEDGEDGTHKLEDFAPDVIITDINMPKMDGFQFIEAVRKNVNRKWTPILVLTTESSQDLRDRARNLGATGWIVKPFDDTILVSAIKKVAKV